MLNAFKEYFLLPFLKVSWRAVISIISFNRREIECNFAMKLPLILKIGWIPFAQKAWLAWYHVSDTVQYTVFGVFDPGATARRILKNSFCPLSEYIVLDYCNDIMKKYTENGVNYEN